MKKLFVILSLSIYSMDSYCQTYDIDPGHTSVQIKVKRFGVVNVVGRFRDVSGTITYDKDDLQKTSANVTIKVDSYDANNDGGEDAIKGPAFLDAATYPEITFRGTNLITKGNEQYLAGDLTIHGVTNKVELPFTITGPKPDLPTKKMSVGVESTLMINRQDYGVSFDRALPTGDAIVGNEVTIELIVLALAQ